MRRPSLAFGGLVGGLTSLPLVALSFLGEQLAGLPLLPFDLIDWAARELPGDVITVGIRAIVRTITFLNLGPTSDIAKLIEQLLGIGMVVGGGGLLGAASAWVLRHSAWSGWRVGVGCGFIAFVLTSIVEIDLGIRGNWVLALTWLGLLIIGWGAVVGNLVGGQAAPLLTDEARAGRRAALVKIVTGSAAVVLAAWGLGSMLRIVRRARRPIPPAGERPTTLLKPSVLLPRPVTVVVPDLDRIEPAPGTRLELTPNEDFYRIDINARPVVIDGASWVLEVEGLFDQPRPLTLSDLMAYPTATQAITMACISNPVGGDLIGTSNWTGVRLGDVLRDLGLRSEAKELSIEAADGFYESVAMEDLMDPRTLLVYGMNGEALSVRNGFPLRIYIPNRYGMKQPKWITRIEAINHEGPGYWVERGWSPEARPETISVIDTVATDGTMDGKVPVGGIAWAGDRGVRKVEVQVDDGEWMEATLRTPPLSPLTWIQWRYHWPMISGRHTFRVRATDGAGNLQADRVQGVRPATVPGYHSLTVTV